VWFFFSILIDPFGKKGVAAIEEPLTRSGCMR
jgi:hypothetical protein